MYNKILVPIDGSDSSIFALEEAITLASSLEKDVALTVFYVSQFLSSYEGTLLVDVNQIRKASLEFAMGKAKPLLAATKIQNEFVTIDGDPAQEICKKARDGNYELIVVGNKGHGLFAELLSGSVSLKVVQHAHCPVLIVRK